MWVQADDSICVCVCLNTAVLYFQNIYFGNLPIEKQKLENNCAAIGGMFDELKHDYGGETWPFMSLKVNSIIKKRA